MKDLASHATVAKPETAARTRQIVCNENPVEMGQVLRPGSVRAPDNSDLVTQLAAKYGLEKAQAQRNVDAVMKGRQI